MSAKVTGKIVEIDEDKCDGCGLCIPSCAEGAIEIIDGKARLVAENLCDGIGNCLGTCPQDAITVTERRGDAFDEQAVQAKKHGCADSGSAKNSPAEENLLCGCPGTMARTLRPGESEVAPAPPTAVGQQSRLRHWPVQLKLVPLKGEMWDGADVLIAADCVSYALPDFHERLLAGKSLAIACPKLDDIDPYVEKLTVIFTDNDIKSVTIAHMEVPCCTGIVHAVQTALVRAGRDDMPIRDITVGADGTIKSDNQ